MTTFDCLTTEELSKKLLHISTLSTDYSNKTKLNIYMAGPWFDNSALMLYNTIKDIDKRLANVSNFNIYYPKDNNMTTPKATFNSNVNAIDECDIVIALIDRKDVGTAWEIGMAYALNKEIYLLGYDKSSFTTKTNLMLAFTGRCFTLDKFAKFLTVGLQEEDYVTIGETWEGIE